MNLESIIKEAKTIGISGHVRPDGDCMGACLGLWNYIMKWYPEKEVTVYLEPCVKKLNVLPGSDAICHQSDNTKTYDVFFCLDCGDSERLGFAGRMFERAKIKCCVDHHVSNTKEDENYWVVPTASSTCELMYQLFGDDKLTKEIAECLYLGIAHDTGVFQYSNTAPSTMRAAAKLLECGVQGYRMIEDTYYEKTFAQQQALGKVLLESDLTFENRCIVASLSLEEMTKLQVTPKDLEGIVSQLRNTQGVDVAVFLYELTPEEYKVSLRSNDHVDVSGVAVHFNGGGHKKAAGFTLQGTRETVIEVVLRYLEQKM